MHIPLRVISVFDSIGLLLTVLFFIPFFNIWVNDKVLLMLGGLYAFLFVPLTVGKQDSRRHHTRLYYSCRAGQTKPARAADNSVQAAEEAEVVFSVQCSASFH